MTTGTEKRKEKKVEYWKWPESRSTTPGIDWTKASIITCGIDVGSVSSQAVIMTDGKLFAYSSRRTGYNSPESARNALNWALEGTGMKPEDIHYTVGTGYGRVNVPFAQRAITEIACHARGANYLYGPSVRTILDVGGQDCKVIRCDERGKVETFLMNDKCAAGTGRGMEIIADLLSVPVQDIGRLSFEVDEEPPPVSSTCTIFAKAEATGLLESGWPLNRVLAAYCRAMAHRIGELILRAGVAKDFAMTGGMAKNEGVVKRLAKELNIDILPPSFDTQIAGAVGAALFAKVLAEKEQKK
ncbi:MAG: benzoyl-CoA reductase, bzd-type, subunit Q [Chloroflexi bacterium]|nr:benzoyl-CoA reductase, bzd-type, subunit Q [Chloroflexota bacterium]MBI3930423.1 benzoyl-CoA reductase, bzd-type, subunit Q [Chloroflexota bacterium]